MFNTFIFGAQLCFFFYEKKNHVIIEDHVRDLQKRNVVIFSKPKSLFLFIDSQAVSVHCRGSISKIEMCMFYAMKNFLPPFKVTFVFHAEHSKHVLISYEKKNERTEED